MTRRRALKPWVTFAGCVLVVVVLYWAQAVLVPIALAVLLTFVLTPPVDWLERWIGRVPAVLAAVTLVFIVLGLAGWGLARQMDHLADDLPGTAPTSCAKIADVRGAGKGGSVEKLQETIDDIKTDLGQSEHRRARRRGRSSSLPSRSTGFAGFAWLGPIVGPLGTAGLVVALVIFMLLERRDLRDRLIGLFGHGQLTITTKAFDEAGTRVSRQLLMQSLVNLVYGIVAGVGLVLPRRAVSAASGAALGAALRFIPYVGPVLGAGAPILVSLAALAGLGRSAVGRRVVRRARAVHEPRAGDRALCRGRGRVAGGAAGVGRVLDVAVGTARPAAGDAADGLPRRARQARARPRVRRRR